MPMGLWVSPLSTRPSTLSKFAGPLQEEGDVQDGAITVTNFDGFTPARMPDAPEIVVELIETGHYPVGAGEQATTLVSPAIAIANAIQIAVGARVCSLPTTAKKV
jgi:isoquinoline 1-oxidoreductase beta subunit